MLTFRSVNSIVNPAARTGSDKTNRTDVTIKDQPNNGIRSIVIALVRMLNKETKKLIDAAIDDAPAK